MHFPPKFLKIVATRGEIFSLKFTKYRLRPDPLGSKALPRPPSRNKGSLLLRGGVGMVKEGDEEGRGKEGEGELAPRC